jgi:tetratricopeptide (TPR) repeat protein
MAGGITADWTSETVCLDRLSIEPTHLAALMGLGSIALATGRRDAARTAFEHAVTHHPGALGAHVTLGNMAIEDGRTDKARKHYEKALAHDLACTEAVQGMARALTLLGECQAAERFWDAGFMGHAVAPRRFSGTGMAREVLYLASARGGNVRLWPWLDEHALAVTVVYADYADPLQPLPPHQSIINTIGDADRAAPALAKAEMLVAVSGMPVINHPARVACTGRGAMAGLCEGIAGLAAPRVRLVPRTALAAEDWIFPLLLRAPGFHTGQHFVRVEKREGLLSAAAAMPGEALFVIEAFDARGLDGLFRKYRVMLVDGCIYPWHLAIGRQWKVHYFSAMMAEHSVYREEEERFLSDMPGVLGLRAMAALQALSDRLGLDYAGVDFALALDGTVLVFEANAAMTINTPPPEPIWDYRRRAAADGQSAARRLLSRV